VYHLDTFWDFKQPKPGTIDRLISPVEYERAIDVLVQMKSGMQQMFFSYQQKWN